MSDCKEHARPERMRERPCPYCRIEALEIRLAALADVADTYRMWNRTNGNELDSQIQMANQLVEEV